MKEKVAVGVIWHGGELVFQERAKRTFKGVVKSYAFPGGTIEDGENSLDALVRELGEELGHEFEAGDFGKLTVIRVAKYAGYFRQARLPHGTELKPRKEEKHKNLVLWGSEQIEEALETNSFLPLTHEYIERHL